MDREPAPRSRDNIQVLVIGGGLAGLSAACELADRGFHVTLLEKRPYLGGRASSFSHPKSETEVDIGQHVFMKCCTYYVAFLNKLNVLDRTNIQSRLRVQIFAGDGSKRRLKRGWISTARLPSPLHLLPASLGYPHLGFWDKLRAAYGLYLVWRTDRKKEKEQLDSQTFYDWLMARGQSEATIKNFWNVVVLPALNDDIRHVSADWGVMLFQEALLNPHGADIGYATVGLSELISEAAVRYLAERSGEVRLGKPIRSLDVSGNRVTGVTCYNGETLEADLYVSALPHDILLTTLLPENLREDPFFARVAGLGWAPIVNVHLWYDRPIVDFDFAAFLNSPIQWVFNRSRILGLDEDGDGDGQHLCISLSGAWDYIDLSKEELFERFAREFRVLFPEAREANVKDYLVVKQRHATCSAEPGAQRQRLPQRTPLENFYLAGDWTLTGWPATMESAVRSGVFCAEAIEQNYRR